MDLQDLCQCGNTEANRSCDMLAIYQLRLYYPHTQTLPLTPRPCHSHTQYTNMHGHTLQVAMRLNYTHLKAPEVYAV